MSDSVSQLSTEDDEIVWTNGSLSDDTDFIVLRHPLLNSRSLPSTLSDRSARVGSDSGLSSALDKHSLCERDSCVDSSSPTAESVGGRAPSDEMHSNSVSSASFEYHNGTSAPTASYDDASAFITNFISSPVKGNDAQFNLLCALIIELGLRPPNVSDLPPTLTSARKLLKAEAHVNIKEYVTARQKGQVALREILKPNKRALLKDIRKGKGISLQWVKQHGLQVLLVTCYT